MQDWYDNNLYNNPRNKFHYSNIISVSNKLTFLHIDAPDSRYGAVQVTHGEECVWEGQWPESDKAKEASSEGP